MTGNLVQVLVGRYAGGHITVADLSSNEDLLVLCDANGSFRLKCLTMSPDPTYVNNQEYSFKLDNSIRSCKLSHDAHLLALGQDNGNVNVSMLYGVKEVFVCLFVHALHSSPLYITIVTIIVMIS
jgi:hypothetical protein